MAFAAGGEQCDLLFKPNLLGRSDLPNFMKVAFVKAGTRPAYSVEEQRRFFRQVRHWRSKLAAEKMFLADSAESQVAALLLTRMESYFTETGNSYSRVREDSEFGSRGVLFGKASPEGEIDGLMAIFSKRFPGYRVMYDPLIYMRTGFAAWIVGNRMGIGDPTLISEPQSRSGDFLHELVHIRTNGAEGSVRALSGKIPVYRDVPRPVYTTFQSHDESTAYSMTYRREMKELAKAISAKDEVKVRHHLRLVTRTSELMVEVTGRNIWTAGMVLHNFAIINFKYELKYESKTSVQIAATADFVADGAKILVTMPVEYAAGSTPELRPLIFDKYDFMFERDRRLVTHFAASETILREIQEAHQKVIDFEKLETARRVLYRMFLERGGEVRTVSEWIALYRQQVK